MATLQKFKLLATQCTISRSPTQSPSASPVIHLRRRKTLRMLLSRHRQTPSQNPSQVPSKSPEKRNPVAVSLKLKDFLMSSPSPERVSERVRGDKVVVSRGGTRARGNLRPFTATLRQRLLRKSFRPVLVGIPE